MQTYTERGFLWIEEVFSSREKAKENGYVYAFYSTHLKCDLYTKAMDEMGHRRVFAKIVPAVRKEDEDAAL